MRKYNIIIVYDKDEENVLMCKREKEPYKGLLNFVGGKVEEGEDNITSAYRELKEETGITKDDINLIHLMNFDYMITDMQLQVFAGKLSKDVTLVEEINELCYINKNEDFSDMNRFAGEGNIMHMINQVEIHREKIFKN